MLFHRPQKFSWEEGTGEGRPLRKAPPPQNFNQKEKTNAPRATGQGRPGTEGFYRMQYFSI